MYGDQKGSTRLIIVTTGVEVGQKLDAGTGHPCLLE